jgi:uridylate kinase
MATWQTVDCSPRTQMRATSFAGRAHLSPLGSAAASRLARNNEPSLTFTLSTLVHSPQRPLAVRSSAAAQQSSSPPHATALKYKRVMLKVSGEALEGSQPFGIDPNVLKTIAKEVAQAAAVGVEIAIVVGGGNFFRGMDRWDGLERATADYVGMLATVMNAICLQSALEDEGVATRVQTAIAMQEVAEPYIRRRAIRHLERGRVVIFGAGTGNPFFTTDTAAALRAAEIGADAFFKATKVDGVYDCDPISNPHAILHRSLSFREVMLRDLQVMDETAITLCKENVIPVVVFNLTKPGNILAALLGDPEVGTLISCENKAGNCCTDNGSVTAAGEIEAARR